MIPLKESDRALPAVEEESKAAHISSKKCRREISKAVTHKTLKVYSPSVASRVGGQEAA